jgi:hypothetical protein
VTFAEREERACEVTDELARWRRAEQVAQDPAGQAGGEPQGPICSRPLPEESARPSPPEVRELMTRRGQIASRRAAARCPRCRKIFSLLEERFAWGTEGSRAALAAQANTPRRAETIAERPQRLVRTAVATRQGTGGFGWRVAAEAMRRGFYQAERRGATGARGLDRWDRGTFPEGSRCWTSCTCGSICRRRRWRPIGSRVPGECSGPGACMNKCGGRLGRGKSRKSSERSVPRNRIRSNPLKTR